MPAKTPMYLKTTTPKRGKRLRLRDFLSGDMISPPMGEVRHSAHVGPEGEGDMFGDVGFLRGKLDMLPALRGQNGRTLSMEREYAGSNGSHGFSYNDHHAATGLLKTTVSMPVFISHEQAPPKPPRLHLEDPVAPPPPPLTAPQAPPPVPPPSQPQESQHGPGRNGQTNGHGPRPVSRWDNGGAGGRATSDLDGAFRRLVPSSGSFSEASSEDSVSECCGPLDPRRGLSLDSDAGLSNEDLRSDSPCAAQLLASHAVAATTVAATTTTVAAAATRAPRGSSSGAGVSRSESLAALDLDLGPSILDDVLGIMDRYKAVDDRWEL